VVEEEVLGEGAHVFWGVDDSVECRGALEVLCAGGRGQDQVVLQWPSERLLVGFEHLFSSPGRVFSLFWLANTM
jgi:hypothetical protein